MTDVFGEWVTVGLIDSESGVIEIYRSEQAVEVLEQPGSLSDEAVLPGFVL